MFQNFLTVNGDVKMDSVKYFTKQFRTPEVIVIILS